MSDRDPADVTCDTDGRRRPQAGLAPLSARCYPGECAVKRAWWKEAVVYQIYPRSFMDSNGDGIGDLRGIIAKLDYLRDLGVDVLWLSPVYHSPNDDNGYDIADYQRIMAEFGTMADFDDLLAGVHARGMKLVMDLVVNHTSDEHAWFVESRSSIRSPKRDWYIWRPPHAGREPNNWASFFGGSAWQWDEATGEYYLHLFSRKQPDLNWRNPELKRAVFEMMRWWLDKGIDGYRMDVIAMLAKAPGLPDAPAPADCAERYICHPELYVHQPGMHELLQEMNREVLCKYDIMTVGEVSFGSADDGLGYVAEDRGELDMIFQLELVFGQCDLSVVKRHVGYWYDHFRGRAHTTITMNNHDGPRQLSKYGDVGRWRKESATLLATFLLTAPGTPYLYQGEEIGMATPPFDSIDQYRDISMRNGYADLIAKGVPPPEALSRLRPQSRDNGRTPMQWSAAPHGGFTSGTPSIQANPDFEYVNVSDALGDADSILHYYRRAIAWRKAVPAIHYGAYTLLTDTPPTVYAYLRSHGGATYLVVLNWAGEPAAYARLDTEEVRAAPIEPANYPLPDTGATMRPWEARVYRLE